MRHGQPSEWSEPANWEMGLLEPDDWQALWITPDATLTTPCPRLRTTFTVDAPVQRARAYITSHGLYALELNGQPASDWLFTPGWTAYRKRLQYQTYDVTALAAARTECHRCDPGGWLVSWAAGPGLREATGAAVPN